MVKLEKQRYEWLDIIKAICIISVVVLHTTYKSNISALNTFWIYIHHYIDLYCVTIFYCIAGITLNNNKLKDTISFLYHKFKKLYLKAIIIGLIAVFFHNLLIKIGFYKIGMSYSGKIMYSYALKDFIIKSISTLLLANREVILGAIWFLNSLIICFILLAIIEFIINKISFVKSKREFRLFITFILMFASICSSTMFKFTIPRFNNSLVGLFLIDLTNYLYSNKKFESYNLYLMICCLLFAISAPFFGNIVMNINVITSPHYFIVVVLSILYLLINLSKKIANSKKNKFLVYVGKNSFSIMIFHFLGFKIAACILNIFGFNADLSLLNPIVSNMFELLYYVIFGICFPLIINIVLKRFLKFSL